MKKLLLSLLVSAMSISSALADTATLTMSSGCLSGLTDTADKTIDTTNPKTFKWTFSATKKNSSVYLGWDSTKGVQIGSGSQPVTSISISSTGFSDKIISSVKINTSGASKITATLSVKVGETAFTNDGNETYTMTANASDVNFTGSEGGEITISYTNTSDKAIYINSIVVEYTDNPDSKQDAEISFPQHDYYVTFSTISSFESPVLDNPHNVEPVKYESSNEEIATVAEDGTVTILKAEEAKVTITATFDGNDDYDAAVDSYVINITEKETHTVTFDFENNEYGMIRHSGSDEEFNPANTKFGKDWIVCTANEKTRLWETAGGNKSLRVYAGGEITITVPEDATITHIGIYHFNANGDPEDVTDDADHEHVASIEGNVATLAADWTSSHHKLSMVEVTYMCLSEVHTAVENAFKASTASDFTVNGKVLAEGAGIEIGEEGSINVVLSHTYPHAVIYHKWEPTVTPAAYYDAIEGYSEHTAPLTLTSAGKLSYYAELNGHQTPVQTIDVTASGTTSINEVEPAVGAKKVYDLMGRKVARPANGLYIVNGVKVRL